MTAIQLNTMNTELWQSIGAIADSEPLKGMPEGRWSRRITDKHRLVYRIFETEVYVDVLAAYGH